MRSPPPPTRASIRAATTPRSSMKASWATTACRRRRPIIPATRRTRSYFDPAYYQGKVPVFDPKIFAATPQTYETGLADHAAGRRAVRLSETRAAAGAAAARPDRRRTPPAGRERLRGAAALHAPHRREGRPPVRAARRGVRVRAARAPCRALRGSRDRAREHRRGPPRPDDPGPQPDLRAQRGRAGHRVGDASSRPTRT